MTKCEFLRSDDPFDDEIQSYIEKSNPTLVLSALDEMVYQQQIGNYPRHHGSVFMSFLKAREAIRDGRQKKRYRDEAHNDGKSFDYKSRSRHSRRDDYGDSDWFEEWAKSDDRKDGSDKKRKRDEDWGEGKRDEGWGEWDEKDWKDDEKRAANKQGEDYLDAEDGR